MISHTVFLSQISLCLATNSPIGKDDVVKDEARPNSSQKAHRRNDTNIFLFRLRTTYIVRTYTITVVIKQKKSLFSGLEFAVSDKYLLVVPRGNASRGQSASDFARKY